MPRTSSTLAHSRTTRLPRASQTGIQGFARATKPGLSTSASLSLIDGKKDLATTTSTPGHLPVSPSKKRKLGELENVDFTIREQQGSESGNDAEENSKDLSTLTPSKSLKFSSLSVSTPSSRNTRRSGHYVSTTVPSPTPRQTRTTRTQPEHEDKGGSVHTPSTPTKPRAPRQTKPLPRSNTCILPTTRAPCVAELVTLHSAFLKALTIHAAHKGVAAPADLREFLPSIERIWKKRKVVVKDLQRLLWVLKTKGCESGMGYRLANHGLGRVCLEKVNGRNDRLDDESELQARFEEAVDLLWEKALDDAGGDEGSVDFMGNLGLVSIEESLAPFTAFRKGQQRLQDLKGGVIKMKMETLLAEAAGDETASTPTKVRNATTSRREGLLDRIKNKQLRQSKLPPPPPKEVLLRRAASGRIEEVAGVLSLLRPAGYVGNGPLARMAAQRTPFCLETIVRNVQDSTRNPISEKEVEACLEILSREDVAGHWVNIVVVNQLKSVVLKSCGDVQLKDIGAKVAQLKPGWEESPRLLV